MPRTALLSMMVASALVLSACSGGPVQSAEDAQRIAWDHLVEQGTADAHEYLEHASTEEDDGVWVVHFASDYPEGTMGIPFAVTVSIDASNGEILRVEEAQ